MIDVTPSDVSPRGEPGCRDGYGCPRVPTANQVLLLRMSTANVGAALYGSALVTSSKQMDLAVENPLTPLLVAESEGGDSVDIVLKSVRTHLGMDVAFVAEFGQHDRLFRHVDAA